MTLLDGGRAHIKEGRSGGVSVKVEMVALILRTLGAFVVDDAG